MRRLVLKAILLLGRYAVLPIVALVCAIFMVWLIALDRYTLLALVTAPIVLPSTLAALALALGLVLLPSRRDENLKVDEGAAPGLWKMWEEFDHAFARPGRTLLIDTDFNASIKEESRYVGLFRRHVTMTVGLPLLIIMDARAIRAVVAHEVAHARLRHTSGATNLLDFISASENLLYYADPDHTITGRVAEVLFQSLLDWLEKERRALSREDELCADRDAAKQVGGVEMARALVMLEASSARLDELVFLPLEKEMIGAIKTPKSPLRRIFEQLKDIRAPGQLAAAAIVGQQREYDPDPTHPPLDQRLANLGFDGIPPIDEVLTSAIDELLTREAAGALSMRFDDEWRKLAEERVSIEGG